jgi:hypothetical protein
VSDAEGLDRDDYKELREQSKQRRQNNRDQSPQALTAAGLSFTTHNGGAHLVVCERFDFWPGTGKWIDRKTRRGGRGVFPLIRMAQALQGNDE